MMAAFDVIKENIPDLEALNLNDNKLHMLDHFKLLDKKAPNLKILYMANNKSTSYECYLGTIVNAVRCRISSISALRSAPATSFE
ncbi:conserved hypothetical protein [Culex quinquefasciatus]|uniref:NXF1/2/3/5-like leucine-rich repeat domain-containing protein n=1 Tax=Culex quinquefasciatus TaxID=7176 RepID=B0XJZ0_CULQU|nr:conserved hypothetical protein [Culex quinquefasciatus]|eukprot:XP_001869962.1 conserved hypothetical protein [Culex quinquefasciatus]